MAPEVSHFEELQGRLRGLLIAVADQLPRATIQLAGEMIDANECGVALETISEMLVESRAAVAPDVLTNVGELVAAMGLPAVNVDRLRPLLGGMRDDGAS
jgi:hypothetical protein